MTKLDRKQVALAVATFNDAKLAGVLSISMIMPGFVISWSAVNGVSVRYVKATPDGRIAHENSDVYRDNLIFALANGLYIVEATLADGFVRSFAVDRDVPAAVFAVHAKSAEPIKSIRVLR